MRLLSSLSFAALLGAVLATAAPTHAQTGVGIGTSSPDASAALDISSGSKGVLYPRVALTAATDNQTVPAPATGLVVFNTAATVGGRAQLLSNAGTAAAPNWVPLGMGNYWGLLGNAGSSAATSFLGTTDNVALSFRVNNQPVGQFQPGGAFWVGSSTSANLFVGYQAGQSNTSGFQNQFIGFTAGQANTTGTDNLFVGSQAGVRNTTGIFNTFLGHQTGFSNVGGNQNVFVGYQAGNANTANGNSFLGFKAGSNNTTGTSNVFVGYSAGTANTTGSLNTFAGYLAGSNNTTGNFNTFYGSQAGAAVTTGGSNTLFGARAGQNITTAFGNVFMGQNAAYQATTASANVFLGPSVAQNLTTAYGNVFIGQNAGDGTTTGELNVAVGFGAGTQNTGLHNAFFGSNANTGTTAPLTNATAIGYNAFVSASNSLVLGGTATNAVHVGIGVTAPSEALQVQGNVLVSGTVTQGSDLRLKTNVRPLTGSLASVERLRAVRYVFLPGKGPEGEQVGVIAQELEAVYPELVRTDKLTGLKSVNYSQLTPVLLQGLKELSAQVQQQNVRLAQLEAQLARLSAPASVPAGTPAGKTK